MRSLSHRVQSSLPDRAEKSRAASTGCPVRFSLAFLLYRICDFPEAAHNFAVVFPSVRIETGRTVFNSVFIPDEISAAPVSQCIERTVTEKAIEVFPVCPGMAGKVFALLVTKIGIFFSLPVSVQRFVSLRVTFQIVMRSVR